MNKSYFKIIILVTLLSLVVLTACAFKPKKDPSNHHSIPVYVERVPGFQFDKNQVFIRAVVKPTMASLDYTAYNANPLFFDSDIDDFKKPEKTNVSDLSFNGLIKGAVNNLDNLHLSQPMSWDGMKNRMWQALKDDRIVKVGDAIASYKWNDSKVFKSYQKVSAVYLDHEDIWVRIDFAPWVDFIDDITDSDGDGIKEVYAKLILVGVPVEIRQRAMNWIREEYQTRLLNQEEVLEWAQVLASYWYPTLNTDLIMAGIEWPRKNTEDYILKQLDSVKSLNPLIIIKGNPMGQIIYNVFEVKGMKISQSLDSSGAASTNTAPKQADRSLPDNYAKNMEVLAKELSKHGDSYDSWIEELSEFRNQQRSFLKSLPKDQMGFEGEKEWIYFRKSLEFTVADDYANQDEKFQAIPHILEFKNWLEENEINFILVPIPPKTEVYNEYLKEASDDYKEDIINPWYRKFIQDAQDEGIEVVDLLPLFLDAKSHDHRHSEKLYQKDDTHWTNRGLQIAADAIAKRITEYEWFDQLKSNKSSYLVKDTMFTRRGDIVERLPSAVQNNYGMVELKAQKVYHNSKANKGNTKDPIVLMGDSFTGVFELVDSKSSGVGSHIAAKTGVGVDVITSWGGGPNVRSRAFRARKNKLGPKRLFIYMMAARDFYNYSQGWEAIDYSK